MGFFKNVHKVVSYIPEGRVMSYGDIAEVIGASGKARFVGFAMKFCPGAYPWHRVVKVTGHLTVGDMQALLLRKEGVAMDEMGCVDMDKHKVYPAEMHLILKEHGEI